MKKSNEQLQKDVQDAINWEPSLNAAEIGVSANDGVVTLTGTVPSYSQKSEAEHAAENVAGVRAVVEKIEIRSPNSRNRTDDEIAAAIVDTFKWDMEVPASKVKVKVENGWVTLEGELHWNYQRVAAEEDVKFLDGVIGVTNNIRIRSEIRNEIKREDIEDALQRSVAIDPEDITVVVSGTKVILTGTVGTVYQKKEAERIAWNAPGVWAVDNQLAVEYEYETF